MRYTRVTFQYLMLNEKKVLEQRINKNTTTIKISSLNPGVYIVEGNADGAAVCKVKLVVIR